MVKEIEGQKSSAEIRAHFAEKGEPVIVTFSRGKDSLATWLALRDAGIEVRAFYMYLHPPNLQFVEDSLSYYEDFFGQEILRYPHPNLFVRLNDNFYQAPYNRNILAMTDYDNVTYDDVNNWARHDFGLDNAWVAGGVRAVDSPYRWASIKRNGLLNYNQGTFHAIGDWHKADVINRINAEPNLKMPIDYEIWKRSFDGMDMRYSKPLSEHLPEDFERMKLWFPLLEADWFRREKAGK